MRCFLSCHTIFDRFRLFCTKRAIILLSISVLMGGLTFPAVTLGDSHKPGSSDDSMLRLPDRQKVVYHVSEAKKVSFVLGNINNHLDGVGGPDRVEIVVVVHGDGHNGFLKSKASQEVATEVELLEVQDVKFEMCGNTLDAYGTTLKDLVGDFKRLNQGGVVRMVELQMRGFAYLRP